MMVSDFILIIMLVFAYLVGFISGFVIDHDVGGGR